MNKKSYIHVDSSKRNRVVKNIYDKEVINLPIFPLYFTNSSSLLSVHLPNHKFNPGDKIVLSNVISKNCLLNNVLRVKKNSYYMKINHLNHGLSMYGLFDNANSNDFELIDYVEDLPSQFKIDDDIPDVTQYYTLKIKPILKIRLSYIKSDKLESIGNIPINYINNIHDVYLIFSKDQNIFRQDFNSYLIKLRMPSEINYTENINNDYANKLNQFASTNINFLNLYGIPLSYINNSIIDSNSGPSSFIVKETKPNVFKIDINLPAIVDPTIDFYTDSDFNSVDEYIEYENFDIKNRGGGSTVFVQKVLDFINSYPDPSMYKYILDKTYTNVISAKLKATTFPNSQKIVNQTPNYSNNKLYWRNLDDGNWIYQISIAPGNYSPICMKRQLENSLNNTVRYRYSSDYLIDPNPTLVKNSKSANNLRYDPDGNDKYHNFEISISDTTDTVSISSFKQILQSDTDNNNIITPYDTFINIRISADLNDLINNLDDNTYFYLTPNSHSGNSKYPYCYYNLYNFIKNDGDILLKIDLNRKIVLNFFKNSGNNKNSCVLKSINTDKILTDFLFTRINNTVSKPAHKMNINDIIITDQFDNKLGIYNIDSVIDNNSFTVKKLQNINLFFDDLFINGLGETVDVSQFVDYINPLPSEKYLLKIFHPKHSLLVGDNITLYGSDTVNGVPADVINGQHYIHRIVDTNSYEIVVDPYQSDGVHYQINTVTIKFPSMFQLFFNFDDTIGDLLGFNNVGNIKSITPYRYTIFNSDKYENQIVDLPKKKLRMTGDDYFYLCCKEFPTIDNTLPVENVFSIVRWTDTPGSVVYDSYVPTKKVFQTPLHSLSQLNFSMYNPNGQLVDFNGLDHSFLIQIVQLFPDQPKISNC